MACDTTPRSCFPQTMPTDDAWKITSEVHGKHAIQRHLHNTKRKDLTESTGMVPAKIPFECQVRTSHNSRVLERGKLCVPWLVRVLRLL